MQIKIHINLQSGQDETYILSFFSPLSKIKNPGHDTRGNQTTLKR